MIDIPSSIGFWGAIIATLWTASQELRFWKLCQNCPYRENYKENEESKKAIAG